MMRAKRAMSMMMALVLILLCCGCGKAAQAEPTQPTVRETTEAAAIPKTGETEETQNPYYTHPRNPDNGDGTFTIGVDDVLVDIATPDGMEPCGCNSESAMFRGEDGRAIQFGVVKVPDDPEMSGAVFTGKLDETCARCEENGIDYQRQTEQISVGGLDFTCEILAVLPEDKPARTVLAAWAPVQFNSSEACAYYLELRTFDDPSVSSAPEDVTMDQVRPWLEAVISAN